MREESKTLSESQISLAAAIELVNGYTRSLDTKKRMIAEDEDTETLIRQQNARKNSREFRWALTRVRTATETEIQEALLINQASFFGNRAASNPVTRAQNPLTVAAYASPTMDIEAYYDALTKDKLDDSLCSSDNQPTVKTQVFALDCDTLDREVCEIISSCPRPC